MKYVMDTKEWYKIFGNLIGKQVVESIGWLWEKPFVLKEPHHNLYGLLDTLECFGIQGKQCVCLSVGQLSMTIEGFPEVIREGVAYQLASFFEKDDPYGSDSIRGLKDIVTVQTISGVTGEQQYSENILKPFGLKPHYADRFYLQRSGDNEDVFQMLFDKIKKSMGLLAVPIKTSIARKVCWNLIISQVLVIAHLFSNKAVPEYLSSFTQYFQLGNYFLGTTRENICLTIGL